MIALLFINYLKSIYFNITLLYADDIKIYRIITSPSDSLLLRKDLNRLSVVKIVYVETVRIVKL